MKMHRTDIKIRVIFILRRKEANYQSNVTLRNIFPIPYTLKKEVVLRPQFFSRFSHFVALPHQPITSRNCLCAWSDNISTIYIWLILRTSNIRTVGHNINNVKINTSSILGWINILTARTFHWGMINDGEKRIEKMNGKKKWKQNENKMKKGKNWILLRHRTTKHSHCIKIYGRTWQTV